MDLFVYQPPDTQRIETLKNNELWLANPVKFNDPFELQFRFENPTYESDSSNEVLKAFLESLKSSGALCPRLLSDKMIAELTEIQNQTQPCVDMKFYNSQQYLKEHLLEHIKSFGVSCFSNEKMNDLMFSYYGCGHSGYMITYEANPLKIAKQNYIYRQVNYTNTMPVVDIWKFLFSDSINEILSSKSLKWAHENEVRIIYQFDTPFEENEFGRKITMPDGLVVKAITAGCKANTETIAHLKSAAEHLTELTGSDVKFHQSLRDQRRYSIK